MRYKAKRNTLLFFANKNLLKKTKVQFHPPSNIIVLPFYLQHQAFKYMTTAYSECARRTPLSTICDNRNHIY